MVMQTSLGLKLPPQPSCHQEETGSRARMWEDGIEREGKLCSNDTIWAVNPNIPEAGLPLDFAVI